ncbi:hypothetical protein F1880_006927 [Penicillium rolfsii]|nr:hypothetical protein F1880_006927 [Penicillium rolfsii]
MRLSKAKFAGKDESFDALRKIVECKNSNTPAEKILVRDTRHSLMQFVRQNPEYPSLLRFIMLAIHVTDSPDNTVDEQIRLNSNDFKNPAEINNSLYTQLRMHSSCSCDTQHLECPRLRLEPGHDNGDEADASFDVLFAAGSRSFRATKCQSRWREVKVLVASRNRTPRKKQVSFSGQRSSPSRSMSPLTLSLRKLEPGEFCRLIGNEKSIPVHFHVQNNVMKFASPARGTKWRGFLPLASVSLAEWLEQTAYLSNRVKITLAYTIARSVWQYFDSYWMANPWTHDNIQIMKETIGDQNHSRPHPYFTTKLHKFKSQILDYCIADDLFHMYPSILALGVILIEIATKQPFIHDAAQYLWNQTTINDYYEWAWTTASGSNLGSMIGAAYEAVVNNCLDAELFRDGPIDPSKAAQDLEIRQSRLYEKVVLPLQDLYHAYRDDWEIQENSKVDLPVRTESHREHNRSGDRSQFSIAIFCALPLEADAVGELFEETFGEEFRNQRKAVGDDNTYTLGKIMHHNVVLVHMAGMGKGAASQAASSLRSSFPEIRLALLVGICGGVPSYLGAKNDLILGDVVISDGIVQYDFGRLFPDTFLSKARPEISGSKIRGLLAKLKGLRGEERIETKLSQHLKVLQHTLGPKRAGYPGMDTDELFQSGYRHKHQDPAACDICRTCTLGTDPICEEARSLTCQQLGCQKGLLIPRKRLQEASASDCPPTPKVHFGFVGSGDTVMKSGQHRDHIASQHDLIAFEMEASGVWDILPCLVIKGVCDYADSHKNKVWQHYAAATAASCMKAVLEECAKGEWFLAGILTDMALRGPVGYNNTYIAFPKSRAD